MKDNRTFQLKKLTKRAVCILLAAGMTISLTACSGNSDQEKTEPVAKRESAATVSNGTLQVDSTVVGVGKTKVLYDEYGVYSWFLKNQYESVMSPDVWNYKIDSTTVGQNAVEDILRLIIQIKVMNKAAAAQGVALGVDEKEDIDYKADQYLATISEDVKKANHITADIMHRIFEENEVARKMYDVVTGNVNSTVDEASLQAVKLLMIHLDADDSNREQVRSKANLLSAELSKYKGNFYSFAEEKTGKAPEETIIGNMDSRKNLANTALALHRSTASGVIEENDGFYIVYCLKNNTNGLRKVYREQYIAEQQNSTFQAAYENWSEKYEVKVSKSLLTK